MVHLRFAGANPAPALVALDPLSGTANYLLGSDPSAWRTGVPTFGRIAYRGLYPGVDVVYYGAPGRLEYDIDVAAGVDPRTVQLGFDGQQGLQLTAHGGLELTTSQGTLTQAAPAVYQLVDGARRDIAARYVLTGADQVGFDLGAYDPSLPLIIDPVLGYATFLGGSGGRNEGRGIALDSAGAAYVTGMTESSAFPTQNPAQPANAGSHDAFVTKLSADGSTLLYSTYLGGSGEDNAYGIAVSGAGNAFVTGNTWSGDFPTTAGAYLTHNAGADDAFVSELSADGRGLAYSTYYGGGAYDVGLAIAVSGGDAYVAGTTYNGGSSGPPPTTAGAYQTTWGGGAQNAWVVRLDPSLSGSAALVYGTLLGGNGADQATGIAVDGGGNAVVSGSTSSTPSPPRPGPINGRTAEAPMTRL